MHLSNNPTYKKVITPWYDTELVCLFTIAFLFVVFLFAMVGVSVARENAEYNEHLWVPGLLIFMSVSVIVSITIRLIRRYAARLKEEDV